MNRKFNVFIGSSREQLKFANKIKNYLESDEEITCHVWCENTFKTNENYLESLHTATLQNDFGLFIASNDDEIKSRGKKTPALRDNVLFEYGMFLGTLGKNKTILLLEINGKKPSDLEGISQLQYDRNYSENDMNNVFNGIKQVIIEQKNTIEINKLPSTALAIGYYISFIKIVARYISENKNSNLKNSKMGLNKGKVEVLIPRKLTNSINDKARKYYSNQNYIKDYIEVTNRQFPIYCYKNSNDNFTIISDIPTTINTIKESLNLIYPLNSIGHNNNMMILEQKELENFKNTLEYLISKDDNARDIVKIDWLNDD